MDYRHIVFQRADGIARITLNRPDKLNSFTVPMHDELRYALARVAADSSLRVLVLTGAGRGFCAGQDLGDRAVAPGADPVDLGASIEKYYGPVVKTLRALPIPVICAVNGVAAGAGANIALACDIVMAARSASFVQAFCKLGLIPDTGGTYFLPRLVGQARATALAMLGDKLSAEQAAAWGLIWKCVDDDQLVKRVLFAGLEAIVGDGCILASNTSSISITSIAAGLKRPQRVIGMHFFNPAPLMALVEVVSGLATDAAVAHVVHDTALAWGKNPVHTKSTPGFIVNRVARPYYAEGLRLLGEGAADAATIDAVMREAGGFRMGPFELMDLIGHDVNYAVTRSVFDAYYGDPRYAPSLIQQELVNAGYLGRKSGRGFYGHAEGAAPPRPASEPPVALRGRVTLWPANEMGAALAQRLARAGVPFEQRHDAHADRRLATIDDTVVALTDGRSATRRAADMQHAALVLHDLVLDPAQAKRIALAAADMCPAEGIDAATALFEAAGYAVSRVDDVPGLAMMRTVAMLANEAAEAVHQRVCDAAAADLAMRKGVNYPRGPLAWADAIGPRHVLLVLDHLAEAYGEDRYRASVLMRRRVAAQRPLRG